MFDGHRWDFMPCGYFGFPGIFWIIVIGIIIYFIVRKNNTTQESDNVALEILKKRFAQGEISVDEFEEMKKKVLQ